MYYEKHRKRRARNAGRLIRLTVCAAALTAALFALLNIRTGELIRQTVESGAESLYTRTVSRAVSEVMTDGDIGTPVRLSRGADGVITAAETDIVSVNRIKSEVSRKVIEALEEDGCAVSVPVGSLTGLPVLAGRGPEISLRLRPSGACSSELYSTLEQAGINQTRHTISCVVTARMYAMLPGKNVPVELSTNVLIAESVIVGRVPESYTNVIGDKSDTIGRIFDYGEPNK